MLIGIVCCRKCTKRYVGCHSTCQDYILEKEKIEYIRQEVAKENETFWKSKRRKR